MNRSQIRTECRSQLGDVSSAKFTDAVLNQWIDLSTDHIIALLDFDTAMATVSSVQNEPNYTFATDQRDIKEIYVTADDNKEYRLQVVGQDEMNSLYGIAWRSDDAGTPQIAYRADYNVVGLHPKPDADNAGKTIRFFYNRNASALSSDSAAPIYLPFLHMANVHWTAQQGFLRMREWQAVDLHKKLFNDYMAKAWHKAHTFADEMWGWRWG